MRRPVPLLIAVAALAAAVLHGEKDDGYRGIWYFNQPSNDEYKYKYSGGFATYPQQHAPIAVYSEKAGKTFFCYGGTTRDRHDELVHMVGYYDHATGKVPRPTLLLNKETSDAHDNPVMSIDDDGYIWIFSSAHGTSRPAYIHKSRAPYSIDSFERIATTNFSYPQPWHLPGKGFLFLHTRYQSQGRALHWMTSKDGRDWDEPRKLAFALRGHYQVSWPSGDRVGTIFNVHPPLLGLNERTNLYYLETRDLGRTWRTAGGAAVETPIESESSPALVRDYYSEKLLVYLKDVQYDEQGRPVLVYLTSKGYEAGPKSGPRRFMLAAWTGSEWSFHRIAESDHNYDHGVIYLEQPDRWRFIAATGAGPQAWGTGGEIEMWLSADRGRTWKKTRELTRNSRYNHTYPRRPLNAHPGFYAIWADGDAFGPSKSSLYFTNRDGDAVRRLPIEMNEPMVSPEPLE
jgi:hypothetical protein